MSSSLPGYQNMRIKGGLVRSRFLFVALNHGQETWSRIQERLPESDRALLAEIAVDEWYPLEMLDRIDRAIAAEVGTDSDEICGQLGEFSATTSLSGPYSSLLNPDIHGFLTQTALIHRSYQDFGAARYERVSDTSGLLVINYDAAPPASFCTSGMSYFRRAVEMCGARAARVTHTRCRSRGDSVCEFYITWQP
jgi:uncharacterized protein (TIGR02265 family)